MAVCAADFLLSPSFPVQNYNKLLNRYLLFVTHLYAKCNMCIGCADTVRNCYLMQIM